MGDKEKKDKKDKKEKKEKKDKKEKKEKKDIEEKKDKKEKKEKKDKKEKKEKKSKSEKDSKASDGERSDKGEKSSKDKDKKKKVEFKENLEEFQETPKKETPKNVSERVNTEYFDRVYEDIQLTPYIKSVCIDLTEKQNQKWTERIGKEDAFYPAPEGEHDHKALILKWNAQITSGQLLNKLVRPNDTIKAKEEIKTNLLQLKNNPDNFRFSNGFKGLENTLGSDKIDLLAKDKQIQEEQVKTYREKTPVYTERK